MATAYMLSDRGAWLSSTELRALGLSTFAGLSTTIGAFFAVVRSAPRTQR